MASDQGTEVAFRPLPFRIGGNSGPIGSFAAYLPGTQKDIDSVKMTFFPFPLIREPLHCCT